MQRQQQKRGAAMANERDDTQLAKRDTSQGPPERPPLSFLQGLLIILFTVLLLVLVQTMIRHHFFRGSRFLHPEESR